MEDFSIYNGEGTNLRNAQLRLLEMLKELDRICKKHNINYWIDSGTVLGAARHKGFIPWDDDIDISMTRKDYLKLVNILKKELPAKYKLQNLETERAYHMLYARVIDTESLVEYKDGKLAEIRKNFKYKGVFLDLFYVERGNLKLKKIINMVYFMSFRMSKYPKNNNLMLKYLASIIWPFSKLLVMIIRKLALFSPKNNWIYGYDVPFKFEFRKNEIFPLKPLFFEGSYFPGPNNVDAYLKRYYGDYNKIPPKENRITHSGNIKVY
jgi:lipopolysaccharide cholinephosphotransferase